MTDMIRSEDKQPEDSSERKSKESTEEAERKLFEDLKERMTRTS